MEPKDYQKVVLKDLSEYLEVLSEKQGNMSSAFSQFWAERGVLNQSYKNNVNGVPHVCAKVPTAGGKTFIATCALETIFQAMEEYRPKKPKFVVWLVPSLTILEQTVKNLSNPEHPYRQKLNVQFNGRVEIYEKQDVLQAAGFDADTVKEQLSILVMSYASLKGRSKEVRKAFQENGYLASFMDEFNEVDTDLPEYDCTSLINVIRKLNPVLVVDESHNAETDLSVEMMKNLNPSFIFDLTATPRKNSNIISFVNAMQLKNKHMVKLPVIVSNQSSQEEVINKALVLRHQLEETAKREETKGGPYIRPIILFQAEPKTDDDSTTFLKIKQSLMDLNIDEEEIKIKTANLNELKGVDLMSPSCPVRYIITINALKEGWDCPFAYILATVANKSSVVDVTQILGRILRMPYVREHQSSFLNMSYVFSSSNHFNQTLQSVVAGLNNAGFSEKDYRVSNSEEDFDLEPSSGEQQALSLVPDSNDDTELDSGLLNVNWKEDAEKSLDQIELNHSCQKTEESTRAPYLENSDIRNFALQQEKDYEQQAQQADQSNCPPELEDDMNIQKIDQRYKEDVKKLKLPQFMLSISGGLFDDEIIQPLSKSDLLESFSLANQNAEISFEAVDSEVYEVDFKEAGDDAKASFASLKRIQKERFNELIRQQSGDMKIMSVVERLLSFVRKNEFFPITDPDVKDYFSRIVKSMSPEQIEDCLQHEIGYVKAIKTKIEGLANTHAEKVFGQWLVMDKVSITPSFELPMSITPSANAPSLDKSLYMREGAINTLEYKVINKVINCENIVWWHRNFERGKGFVINGFLNHYPDFIVLTTNKTVLIIETKGDDRDNSDSEAKLRLGQKWTEFSRSLSNQTEYKFRYMMVFENNPIDGAYNLADAIEIIKEL